MGVIALTPRVLLFTAALALFPFISTVTGSSLKVAGLEVWKYLWIVWLGMLAIHVVRADCFFDKWGGRLETAYWLFITFMLVFAPKIGLVIDPWKNWFFCTLAIFLFRLNVVANADEIRTMVKSALGLWWAYTSILIFYVMSNPNYPGGIQHQIFLSGLLGLVAGLLLLSRYVLPAPEQKTGYGFYLFLLLTMLVNVVLNLTVTEARSIFPFSCALVLIAVAWLLRSTMRPAPRVALRFGLPLAFLLTLLPLLHLSGTMGNLVNELTYPIFGKIRTIESETGREVVFRIWWRFNVENARLIGGAIQPLPAIHAKKADEPLHGWSEGDPPYGMSSEEFAEIKRKGAEGQKKFNDRMRKLDLKLYEGTLAITTPHNQWLDATARSGVVYALAIAWAFGYVVWLISCRLGLNLPAPLLFGYWAMAVAWGFASQFDDEHWLYHIPYLALFFIPVIASAIRACAEQAVHASEDAPC